MKSILFVLLLVNCLVFQSFGQAVLIQGTVIGDDSKPLEDAHVIILAKGVSGITDKNGKFQLSGNLSGLQTIVVSYAGYKTNEQQITAIAGQNNNIDFVLEPSVIDINAIVVTATRSGRALKDRSEPLSATDAHGFNCVASTSAVQLTQRSGQDAHPSCAHRMAQ